MITQVRYKGNLKGIVVMGREGKLHYYLTKEVETMDEAQELLSNIERESVRAANEEQERLDEVQGE